MPFTTNTIIKDSPSGAEGAITSAQNPKIKRLLQLQQKSSERRKAGLFVVEGIREAERCMEKDYEIDTIFYLNKNLSENVSKIIEKNKNTKLFEVSPTIYEKIAYRGSTEGVIAEVKTRDKTLQDLKLSENPLVVVLESVEKPGNLGAILRSADAAGADALIVCDPLTDLYNPNLIRNSTGAIFSVPCVACTSEECIKFLKENNIQILTAQLQDSELYYDTDMKRGTAIVMGTEATGLTDIWRKAADAHIRIPMLGITASLNVSVSAAILLYEAVRQREA